MREFWLSRGWYIALWLGAFVAARLWLVNPIVSAIRELKK